MYKFVQILKIDLINLFTNPMWLAFAIGLPIGLVYALGWLARSVYPGPVSAYDYYGVAVMIYMVMNSATTAANSFMEDRIRRPNLRIVYSPVRPGFIHFSKVLSSFVFCSLTYLLVAVFLHLATGVNFGGDKSWAVAAVMLLAVFACSALGVSVCCLLKSESSTNQLLSLLISLFGAFGGLFFPVDGLGRVLATVSCFSPAKWMMQSSLRIIYDGDLSVLPIVCTALVVLSAVCLLISARSFKGEEYL